MSRRFKDEDPSRKKEEVEETIEEVAEVKEISENIDKEEPRESRSGRNRKSTKGSDRKKKIKLVGNILYWILVAVTALILIVVILQRFNLSLAGYKIFNVITESMKPEYVVGDVLLSKTRDVSEIEVGDDVVYLGKEGDFADRIVTHRVIDIKEKSGERIFHTKGIANDEEDPPISGDQILGVVVYKIRSISLVSKTINNLYSFYFIVFLPIVILMFIEIRRIVLNKKKDED